MALGRKTGGRQQGTPNKLTGDLRAMILGALEDAGGRDYLKLQACENPTAFMTLLGKVLPMQVSGENRGELRVDFRWQDAATPAVTDDTATDQTTPVEDAEVVWADHSC